jgi:hypothetical protein
MLKRMSALHRPLQTGATLGQCSHCGQPLSALLRQQRATHCRAAPCLARADLVRAARQQAQLGAQALAAATAQQPPGMWVPARVVFLQAWEPVQVALTEAQRDSHLAYLQAVVADGTVIDDSRLAAFTAVDGLPQADRLCAHCRGHCCQHGLGWHAFMDQRSLQRWADTQDGATLDDAVHHFMAQLPATHADGGCLYQGEEGCVLPRAQRADICNGFACRPLQEVQQAVLDNPQATVVALSVHAGQAQRPALVSASTTLTLKLPPHALASAG